MNGSRIGRAARGLLPALTLLLAGTAAAQETATIKLASFTSPQGANNACAMPRFIEAVEAAADGTLEIEFYPGGVLGRSPATQFKLVEDGVADIAQVVASYTPGRFPELALLELPLLAENNVEGSLLVWRMIDKGFVSGLENVKMVGAAASGPYGVHGTFPIEAMESLRNKKIRAAGPIQGEIVRALGGTPVGNITAPQIAESISRGLLDGTLMSTGSLYSFRIADVAHHHMGDVALGSVPLLYPMNRRTYEGLPPKAKAAIDRHSGEWLSRVIGECLDEDDRRYLEQLQANPEHKIHELSAEQRQRWVEALQDVKTNWEKPNQKGVNLYQEAQKILEEVRSAEKKG